MARVSLIDEQHPQFAPLIERIRGARRGRLLNIYRMLLHSPGLARHVLGIVNFFRNDSVVEQKLRSLAILVAAREREGAYVWAAQAAAARRAGVREEAIDLIRAKGDPAKLPPGEREIVAYAQQLVRTNRVDQAAFDALEQRHGARWMVELTAALNYFGFLCGIVNAFEVAAPADGDKMVR